MHYCNDYVFQTLIVSISIEITIVILLVGLYVHDSNLELQSNLQEEEFHRNLNFAILLNFRFH